MGIDTAAAQLVLLARNYADLNPRNALIFGHQKNYIGSGLIRALRKHLPTTKEDLSGIYADGFLRAAGIMEPDILDVSNYENANVIFDLNQEIPDSMQKYSLVIDVGTLEHVFNVNQGLENIKKLCQPGGYVLMMNPANNWLGHGFYQFSPELLFRNFDDSMGWEIKAMYLVKKNIFRVTWYEVIDPKVKRRRGSLRTKVPTYVGVIARKKEERDNQTSPQQSDYVDAWQSQSVSRAGAIYLRAPKSVRLLLDHTVMAALVRYRGRLPRLRFQWQGGNYVVRQQKGIAGS